jgi:hypothetical protein
MAQHSHGMTRPDPERVVADPAHTSLPGAAARHARIACFRLAALAVSLCLTACVPPVLVPNVSRDSRTQQLAQMKLLDLGSDAEVHAVKDCGGSAKTDVESCRSSSVSLLLRPAGWSMTQLANQQPLSIANLAAGGASFSLPNLQSGATNYAKPLIGQRNTRDRFIGSFSTPDDSNAWFVWLPPEGQLAYQGTPADTVHERLLAKVSFPQAALMGNASLLLQDADKLWLFIRRDDNCEDSLCITLAEVLAGGARAIPQALQQHKYSLYFASDANPSARAPGTKKFERVLRQPGRAPGLWRVLSDIPKPQGEFVFDRASIGYSTFSAASPSVSCEWSSYTASMVVMLTSEKTHKSTPRLIGCKVLADAVPLKLDPVPAPPVAEYSSDDPAFARRTSNYFCSASPGEGQSIVGHGAQGCGFVLKDPVTRAAMPMTAYSLGINVKSDGVDAGKRIATLAGVTDRHGRTAFVRTDLPIETDLIGLVRRYRTPAELSGPLEEFSGREVTDSKRLDSLKDGLIIWSSGHRRATGTPYRIRLCTGEVHEARTDENAMTIGYDPSPKRPCAITVELLSGR